MPFVAGLAARWRGRGPRNWWQRLIAWLRRK